MYKTVGKYEFVEELEDMFSREVTEALFEFYSDLEEVTGKDMEFDPVAIRCDWTEYESFAEFSEEHPEVTKSELLDSGTVIELEDGKLAVCSDWL